MDIIKVKALTNGLAKGRAYTYKSEIPVEVGDLVIADLGGREQTLQVVETNVNEESVGYELKTILYKMEVVDQESEPVKEISIPEITVEEEVAPVIHINYEQVKNGLLATLNQYAGIVVTDQNLQLCKSMQRELAGIRSKIDNYRKEKKKELSAPITAFESQCKELISMVEEAEKPIKEGIKVYDDQRREKKKKVAESIREEVIEQVGLESGYANRLGIVDKYFQLTATESDVRQSLLADAMQLKAEQDANHEKIDMIQDIINHENQKINHKLKLEDFEKLLEDGMSASSVIHQVYQRSREIYAAENDVNHDDPEVESPVLPSETDPMCYCMYRVVAPLSALRGVSKYMQNRSMSYTVVEQGMVE